MSYFKMFCSFEGRVNRQRFLIAKIIIILLSIFTGFLISLTPIFYILMIPIFYLETVIIVNRLHDLDYSGKNFLYFYIIPLLWGILAKAVEIAGLVIFIFSLMLLFKKGTSGKNKYGNDPLTSEILDSIDKSASETEKMGYLFFLFFKKQKKHLSELINSKIEQLKKDAN